jgi:hypothetical protein
MILNIVPKSFASWQQPLRIVTNVIDLDDCNNMIQALHNWGSISTCIYEIAENSQQQFGGYNCYVSFQLQQNKHEKMKCGCNLWSVFHKTWDPVSPSSQMAVTACWPLHQLPTVMCVGKKLAQNQQMNIPNSLFWTSVAVTHNGVAITYLKQLYTSCKLGISVERMT